MAARRFEGTGLGLAVVHGIVNAHRGAISLESREGVGTTFHVYLPTGSGEASLHPGEFVTAPRGAGELVCIVDDEVRAEWAYIPHFYYNFYVFQYATSLTASGALSEEVLAGDKDATKRYLELLKSGGSDYPIALLKKAGIDMTTSAPFELAMKKMNRVMDEIEQILDRRKK